jgi:hypothetical protein
MHMTAFNNTREGEQSRRMQSLTTEIMMKPANCFVTTIMLRVLYGL